MTDETVVRQDAAQIRMTLEQDAEEIEGLALVPVGSTPDIDDGWHDRRIIYAGVDTQTQTVIVLIDSR